MILFSYLLFSVTGLISYFISPYFLLLLIPISLVSYYWNRNKRRIIYGLILTTCFFLLGYLFPKGSKNINDITGIVVSKKESYYLILSLKGKYLVYDNSNEINILNILHLNGKVTDLSFSHFEQGFDFKSYLKSQGVYYQFVVKNSEVKFKIFSLSSIYQNWISKYLDSDSKEIVFSLLFSRSISNEKRELFSLYSFNNIFSTSGIHISFLLNVISNLSKKKLKDKSEYLVISVIVLLMFLTGFKFTIRRIFIYHIIRLVCNKKNIPINSVSVLSLTTIILLFFQPYIITSSSFYYSIPFLFFIRLFPVKEKGIKGYLIFVLQLALFYLPFKLCTDFKFSILGLLLQVALSPISILLFILSIFLIIPQLGFVINFIVKLTLLALKFGDKINIVLISGEIHFAFVIIYYLLLFFLLTLRFYNYKFHFKIHSVTFSLFVGSFFIPDYFSHYEVHFVDVDQGDCTLIRNKRKNILIDTGGLIKTDLAKESLIPYFNKLKITHIDCVILTHLDYDHFGALDSLKNNFKVDQVLQVEDFISNGNTFYFDSLEIKNLNFYDLSLTKDKNYHSGVYKFSIRDNSFLVMGDAPKEIEYKILKDNPKLDIDYLKVGHHGSNTSTSDEIVKVTSPKEAIISCGEKNRYKFPHAEVLNVLNNYKVKIRRTDLEGTIVYKFWLLSLMKNYIMLLLCH